MCFTFSLDAPDDVGGAVNDVLVVVVAEGGLAVLLARVAPGLTGLLCFMILVRSLIVRTKRGLRE